VATERVSRPGLAVGLFLLAPFIGEFVLGNQAITSLPMLLVYAPMYGGGALLVRETARRAGAGWPAIIALGAAYALTEEGLIDQMLVNPGYLGLGTFDGFAPIPGLGISARLLYESLSIHTVWSVCVSIAIAEAFDRRDPAPWLGPAGWSVVAAVFLVGSTALAAIQYVAFQFLASPLQFTVMGAAIAALVVLALTVLRRPMPAVRPGASPAPGPRVVGATAFAVSSLYWALDILVPDTVGAWWALAAWAVLAAAAALLLARCSGRPGWGRAHRLAVAGGTLMTYVWVAFINASAAGIPLAVGVAGSIICGVSAVVLVVLAGRSERRWARGRGGRTAAISFR
jgi:hypothetical protein